MRIHSIFQTSSKFYSLCVLLMICYVIQFLIKNNKIWNEALQLQQVRILPFIPQTHKNYLWWIFPLQSLLDNFLLIFLSLYFKRHIICIDSRSGSQKRIVFVADMIICFCGHQMLWTEVIFARHCVWYCIIVFMYKFDIGLEDNSFISM